MEYCVLNNMNYLDVYIALINQHKYQFSASSID